MHQSSIAAIYAGQFHSKPTLLVRAPGRINLIGEHTDYNGGIVLPGAIPQAIWIAIGKRDDSQLHLLATDLNEFVQLDIHNYTFQQEASWANYLLGVLREFQDQDLPSCGLNIAFGGTIPTGAGLSSSAALVSGMAVALNSLFQLEKSQLELVRLAQRAENNFVGTQCGIMDMFASIFGRRGQVIQLDCRSLSYRYFSFQSSAYRFVLLDSGVKHQLVESEYNIRRSECESGVALLQKQGLPIQQLRDLSKTDLQAGKAHLPSTIYQRCLFVVEEIERVQQACQLLEAGDLEGFGALLTQCHQGLHTLYDVCVPETNFLVEQATCRAGVLGARQMGGGFGGCVLCLVDTDAIPALLDSLQEAYQAAFGINLKAYPVELAEGASVVAD